MKFAQILLLPVAFALFALQAQEATDLDLRAKGAEPTPTPIPEASNLPELSQLDEAFKKSSLGKDADDQRLHIEWRQLANRMANDPEVIAARNSIEQTRTDLEKRERLRAYYNLYYGKMKAIASSEQMRHALDVARDEHLAHINQPRVRHETDGALPTPQPTPRRGSRKKK